jgi:hypothetical protein
MFSETVLLDGKLMTLELRDDMSYLLRYADLVEYSNGRRRIRGRSSAYEFRSVEQLRYDFEEDVKSLADVENFV